MTNITLIICLLSLISISSAKLKHGNVCRYNSDCEEGLFCMVKYNGTTRYDYLCGCKAGYGFNQQSSNCTSFGSYQCTTDYQCQDNDRYRMCNQSKCVCKDKYEESTNKSCTRIKAGHFESCEFNENCKGNLYCRPRTNKCICKQGYSWSKTDEVCKSFDLYKCGQDTDCQDRDPNRICSRKDKKCQCKDGYKTYFDNICIKKNLYNESCNGDEQCVTSLKCYDLGSGGKKCQCQPGYFWRKSNEYCS